MKSEGLAPIIRALYHAIEILTVFLMLFIFVLQLVTPMYAVQSGNASALLAALLLSGCSGQKQAEYRADVQSGVSYLQSLETVHPDTTIKNSHLELCQC